VLIFFLFLKRSKIDISENLGVDGPGFWAHCRSALTQAIKESRIKNGV
jgi:hypothetical protein